MKDEQEIQQIKGQRPDPRAHKIIGDESMQDEQSLGAKNEEMVEDIEEEARDTSGVLPSMFEFG